MVQILLINIPLLIPTFVIFTTICNSAQVNGGGYATVETGKIYKLIQSLNSYPDLKPKYNTYYKEKYGITSPNWKFPVVRNLEKYLSPFSQCFVHITNFQNVNFQSQSTVPIVIRHQVPSKITAPNFFNQETLTWAPTEFNATRASINHFIVFQCPLSKYLVDRSFLRGMCSSIDKFKFSFNTRPWNCEVAVSLFPPLYVFEYFGDKIPFLDITLPIHLSIPPLWTIAPNFIYSLDTFYESNIFNIWILDELYEKTWSHRHGIQWKKSRYGVAEDKHSIMSDTFTLLKTTRLKTLHKIIQEDSYITKIVVPIICETISSQECKNAARSYILNENVWTTGSLSNTQKALFQNFQNRLDFEHQKSGSMYQQQNFMKHFVSCTNWISHKHRWVNLPYTSARSRYAHAFVHVWLAIMGNYTYHVRGYECSNGILRRAKADDETNPVFTFITMEQIVNMAKRHSEPFSFSDPFNSLRFVSCGRPIKRGLPFEKLFSAFEWEIWVWLIICLGGLALLPESDVARRHNRGLKFYLQNILNRLQFQSKALLEQGSNFLASPYMSPLTQAIFLLLGIVISNAYKGENVFQLISNRQIIPYHYFSELTRSKFVIYTRVDEVHVLSERAINVSEFSQTQHNVLPQKDPYFDINCGSINQSGAALIEKLRRCERFVTSEVFQLISSLVVTDHKADVESKEYDRLERLWNNTKLLPNFWKLYKNVQDEVRKYSGPEYYYIVFQSSLLKLQERHSFEVLKECNKVAVILPALTCNQIANNLSRNENLADVFVGKEVLYDRAFRVKISGSVSVNLIMRAKWVMGSGIWDFWSQIFEHRELFNEDKSSETQLKAPSMSGNISVVFTIILFGIVCSLVVFVLEAHAGIYDFGRATTKFIKTFFIYFYSMIVKLLNYIRFLVCNYSGLSTHL
ncbi:unnamed protein product [Orchesella dallaii]|uniref:Uncharacterized protein n=1 Tax=Orchesella dallaii TaxID=48710 RepID=A0ABP1RAN5_9HEXA